LAGQDALAEQAGEGQFVTGPLVRIDLASANEQPSRRLLDLDAGHEAKIPAWS
jgi:hypothetical protein